MYRSGAVFACVAAVSGALCAGGIFAAPGFPIVRNGTIYTSDGELVRGAPLAIAKTYARDANTWGLSRSNLIKFRDEAHLNTVRISCLGQWETHDDRPFFTLEETAYYADSIIALCDELGLTVIFNYHGPWITDGYSEWDIRNFWDFFAPRYKDLPFVILELENENWQNGPPPDDVSNWQTQAVLDVYNHARSRAPESFITGMCEEIGISGGFGNWLRDVFGPAAGIDWSAGKDAYAFHPYRGGLDDIREVQAAGIPVIGTEWGYAETGYPSNLFGPQYYLDAEGFEEHEIAWCDWHKWNDVDQLKLEMSILIPDAIEKEYAWWDETPAVEDHPVPIRMLAGKSTAAHVVQPNGRTVGTRQGYDGKYILRILPESLFRGR